MIDGTRLGATDPNGQIRPEGVFATINTGAFGDFVSGGLYVAVGDANGDGRLDVLAGVFGPNQDPRVITYGGPTLEPIGNVLAASGGGLRTGIRIIAADIDGDGTDDLLATAGLGGGPQFTALNAITGEFVGSEFVFDPALRTGFGIGG